MARSDSATLLRRFTGKEAPLVVNGAFSSVSGYGAAGAAEGLSEKRHEGKAEVLACELILRVAGEKC